MSLAGQRGYQSSLVCWGAWHMQPCLQVASTQLGLLAAQTYRNCQPISKMPAHPISQFQQMAADCLLRIHQLTNSRHLVSHQWFASLRRLLHKGGAILDAPSATFQDAPHAPDSYPLRRSPPTYFWRWYSEAPSALADLNQALLKRRDFWLPYDGGV